ncbi:DUF4350 domain-containing protein [Streptomyces sp. KR80]|uniref:DUF4350 domain-containing protein n=1 Tax=Streptomyces sp. KR80 TaxID=3457426 RepID=UPI003FD67CBC
MNGTAEHTTSTSPTVRQLWTRSRGFLLAVVVLVLAGVVLAAVRSGERHGRLDPRSAAPSGSRAVAELLKDHGVTTDVVTTTAAAADAADHRTTVLVTDPERLTGRQQSMLHSAFASSGGRTVLLTAEDSSAGLAPGVRTGARTGVTVRSPNCTLPSAERAGPAELGGVRYEFSAPGVDACYRSAGLPTLLRIPGPKGGDTVLLGSPHILFNDHLAKQGNASLALQLLGSRPHLVWYLPSLADTAATDGAERGFFDLIPTGWNWALLQLTIAAALAALWRARRLGPLVPERLPVAVRAAEATEGRARLYQQANARDRSAEALRTAMRTRLAPLVGIPAAQVHSPHALCPAVAAHLAHPAPDITFLLFGPAPADDSALIRLADELDELERAITSDTASLLDSVPPSDSAPPPIERDRTP